MTYINPEDTIGKIIWIKLKNLTNDCITYVLKVKDVRRDTKSNVVRFMSEYCIIMLPSGKVYYRAGGTCLNLINYDMIDAPKELLCHIKDKLNDTKYYKLIEQDFSMQSTENKAIEAIEDFKNKIDKTVDNIFARRSQSIIDNLTARGVLTKEMDEVSIKCESSSPSWLETINERIKELEAQIEATDSKSTNSIKVNKPQVKLSFL